MENLAATLYRTHQFSNVSHTFGGDVMTWSAPAISEVTGKIGGSIVSGGSLSIDVGDLSNLNQGRNAPNVQNGSAMANLNVQGPTALPDGPGHGGAQGRASPPAPVPNARWHRRPMVPVPSKGAASAA